MVVTGAAALRRQLTEVVDQIVSLRGPHESEGKAFNTFRHAVTQASSGRLAPPSELLDDLEPKDIVLHFLLDLYERKRIFRKQIVAVIVLLMDTAWLEALKSDEVMNCSMSQEVRTLLEDGHASSTPVENTTDVAESNVVRPLPTILGPGGGTLPDLTGPPVVEPMAEDAIPVVMPVAEPTIAPGEPAPAANTELNQARGMLEKLDYSAVKTDEAIDAYEFFHRSIVKTIQTSGTPGRDEIERMENKDRVLEFMVDFQCRKSKYRGRVNATLARLLQFDEWKQAVDQDPSVGAAVRDLTDDMSKTKRLTIVDAGVAVNLRGAAAAAASRGGVGALFVRVISASGLDKRAEHLGRKPDPYVRITLGSKSKFTCTLRCSTEPRWDSSPFLLEVPSLESTVKFDILDNDLAGDCLLGSLSIVAADAPREPGFVEHHVEGPQACSLELEVVYMPGPGLEHVTPEADLEHVTSENDEAPPSRPESFVPPIGSWIVVSEGGKASTKNPVTKEGPLCCPAGHVVDKRKVGLHWHEGWLGSKHGSHCDLCGSDFQSREAPRWRCAHHCHFDVCERCYRSRS